MKRVVVFCASGIGEKTEYRDEAYRLGQYLAQNNIELVYGGASIGLMGAVADGALSENGTVIGVLPRFLSSKEVAHHGLSELILVESMHERKLKMHELSDGIITLPGGFGTFEELFEMLTWAQLGLHQNPIGLLNTLGYYDHLQAMIYHMRDEGLLRKKYVDLIMMSSGIEDLVSKMKKYTPVEGLIRMEERET